MEIRLDKPTERRLIQALQQRLQEEFGEEAEVGELKATLFLKFCLETLGPAIYNLAIADAKAFLGDRLEDLESVCFVPEKAPRKGR